MENSPKLKTLIALKSSINEDMFQILERCTQLEAMDVSYCDIGSEEKAMNILRKLPNLKFVLGIQAFKNNRWDIRGKLTHWLSFVTPFVLIASDLTSRPDIFKELKVSIIYLFINSQKYINNPSGFLATGDSLLTWAIHSKHTSIIT